MAQGRFGVEENVWRGACRRASGDTGDKGDWEGSEKGRRIQSNQNAAEVSQDDNDG